MKTITILFALFSLLLITSCDKASKTQNESPIESYASQSNLSRANNILRDTENNKAFLLRSEEEKRKILEEISQ